MIFAAIICLVIHCAFYIIIFSRLAMYADGAVASDVAEQKASLVVCYYDEEDIVDANLPSLIDQHVDELILVDDNSSDSTLSKLNAYTSERVKVVSIKSDSYGKKQALHKGILTAANNKIVLTDADCKPASKHWTSHMCKGESSFVLGYGPMNKASGWVATFSRFETYITALQYLSYALIKTPYMGVGRNMRIDKKLVLEQKDTIKGTKLASGDDDLMINALATGDNTSICINPESFVYSDPKTSIKAFLNQKTRHISTSSYYRPIHKILLSLFSGSQILFFSALLLGLCTGTIPVLIALLLLSIKWVIQQTINFPAMKKLQEDDLFLMVPILDLLLFVYLLVLPVYYLFNKNNTRWS